MRTKLLVLQPTSLCNLNCTYCYVPDRQNAAKMSDEVLAATFDKLLQSDLVQGRLDVLWHAGEPLTVGIPYFENALSIASQRNPRAIKVTHTIQTNGVLLTDKWCDFLVSNDFSVGVSIDGPQEVHDRVRKRWNGTGSFDSAVLGYTKLRRAGLDAGVLCVLTAESLLQPKAIFEFFSSLGPKWIAFNVEEVEGENALASTSPNRCADVEARYESFVSEFFRLWHKSKQPFRVREFDDLLSLIPRILQDATSVRLPDETMPLTIVTVRRNGDISTFSPEFAGARSNRYGDFVIGNVLRDSMDSIANGDNFSRICHDVQEGIKNCASSCQWFALCGGAYVSNKYFENDDLHSTTTTACKLHRQTLARTVIGEMRRLRSDA